MRARMLVLPLALAVNGVLAAPGPATRAEVEHLLEAVEKSQCQFNRNGSLHDARSARVHLRKKYEFLEKKDLLTDAESFIERGATKSSSSGKDYLIQCPGAKPVPSAVWLMEELKRHRKK